MAGKLQSTMGAKPNLTGMIGGRKNPIPNATPNAQMSNGMPMIPTPAQMNVTGAPLVQQKVADLRGDILHDALVKLAIPMPMSAGALLAGAGKQVGKRVADGVFGKDVLDGVARTIAGTAAGGAADLGYSALTGNDSNHLFAGLGAGAGFGAHTASRFGLHGPSMLMERAARGAAMPRVARSVVGLNLAGMVDKGVRGTEHSYFTNPRAAIAESMAANNPTTNNTMKTASFFSMMPKVVSAAMPKKPGMLPRMGGLVPGGLKKTVTNTMVGAGAGAAADTAYTMATGNESNGMFTGMGAAGGLGASGLARMGVKAPHRFLQKTMNSTPARAIAAGTGGLQLAAMGDQMVSGRQNSLFTNPRGAIDEMKEQEYTRVAQQMGFQDAEQMRRRIAQVGGFMRMLPNFG
jgi:hypothetical protein